ncbi:alanine/glycine:cation symporter family protein [Nocardia coubleae]|uniref:Alanine:cation symporter family protein n=1 Tax=Nocardia coubleae TaxID=356147 RepID=A0A846W4Y8_9NOCA|nr:alanine/glycine:cation symporter family protein [Nocardia coubleae]NKX87806.1 alanine:cation symporter family protein [Nocardia coubleae]
MDTLNSVIVDINNVFWNWLLIPLVIVAGVYFTARTGIVQLRFLPEMFRVVAEKGTPAADGKRSVSAFGAFSISAAARVGTGNIAGVATAISVGGPGAVFWMWAMATLGAASAFVESTLAQLYKRPEHEPGTFRGGPAYYMQHGLGRRWQGLIFAVVITVTFGFVFNAVQANTIVATSRASLAVIDGDWFAPLVGLALVGLLGLVIFGGVRRISRITEVLVPVMAMVYLLLGIAVVALNLDDLPRVFADIVGGAFGLREVVGGGIGMAITQGIRRGMFSNEAGLGSSPNAAAAADVSHPVKQGLVQSLGVYFDTLLVCSITAFIILTSDPDLSERHSADLTQTALHTTLGSWAGHVLTAVVFMLAFSSMIGNFYYGRANIEFITDHPRLLTVFRVLVLVAVFGGALGSVALIWNLADVFMGVMALVNLTAILPLGAVAFRLLADYRAQRRAGKDPVYVHRAEIADPAGVACWQTRRD